MEYLYSSVTAIFCSLVSGFIAVYVARLQVEKDAALSESTLRHEYKTEYSVESAVHALMMENGFELRSFSVLRYHIRGFSDNELRQLLVRSGCICFERSDKVEFWGLLNRNKHRLRTKKDVQQSAKDFLEPIDGPQNGKAGTTDCSTESACDGADD